MNINEALGMRERPLQVGDWVECTSKPGDGCYEPRTLALAKLTWPRMIIGIHDGYVELEGFKELCNQARFRRVDPPTETIVSNEQSPLEAENKRLRDEVAGLIGDKELAEMVAAISGDNAMLYTDLVSMSCVNMNRLYTGASVIPWAVANAIASKADKEVAELRNHIADSGKMVMPFDNLKPDADLCRKLRELLQRKAGTEYVINIEQVIGIGIYGDFRKSLIAIRDGGAK